MASVDPSHDTATWTTLLDSPEVVTPEVVTVVGINLTLAIVGFLLAFYLTRLRLHLARFSDWLSITEQYSQHLLPLANSWLNDRHQSTQQTRDRLEQTQLRLQLLQQSLTLILWILRQRGRIRTAPDK